jgi:hypothetical protein
MVGESSNLRAPKLIYRRVKAKGEPIMKTVAMIFVVAAMLAMTTPASAGGRPLSAQLAAANEVPASGTGASGTAHITLNQGQGEVCVDISTMGLSASVIAGHIHNAPAGANGGVVVNLGVNSSQFTACVQGVDHDLIKAIRQHPENYYINVHTTAVPSGEIRGQLAK